MFTRAVSDGPLVFHLVNIVYYIVFCWLTFVLLGRLFRDRLAAILGTLVFLFHPLHAESVMWISGLPELLMGIFAILAFLSHDSRRYRLAGFLFFLALLSKETAIALIPVVIIYDSDARSGRSPDPVERRGWRNYIWYVLAFAVYLVMRIPAVGLSKKIPFDFGVSFWEKASAVVSAFGLYFKKLFLPWPLSPVIPIEPGFGVEFWAGLALFIIFVSMFVYLISRQARNDKEFVILAEAGIQLRRFLGFGLLIYFFFLLPPLAAMFSAFTRGDLIIADRYLSFPLIGFAIILGYLVGEIFKKSDDKKRALCYSIAPVVAILAFWGWQTFNQNKIWASSQNLYEHIYAVNEKRGFTADKTTFNLAVIYEKNGETGKAETLYSGVISRAGDFPLSGSQAANNLGLILMRRGDLAGAESLFRKAMDIFPSNPAPKNNLDLLKNGVK